MNHPFIKLANCKDANEFYSKFKTEDAFFKKFPEAKSYLNSNGQTDVSQNQTLKSPGSDPLSFEFTNVKTLEGKNPQSKEGSTYKDGGCHECDKMQMGGIPIFDKDTMKSGGHWIHTNPENKGDCTPMSKPTCTGHKRAFALTMKKHHGFHKKQMGGGMQDTDLTTDPMTGNAIQPQQSPAFNPNSNAAGVPQSPPPPGVNTGNNWATGMTPEQAQASIGPDRNNSLAPQPQNKKMNPWAVAGASLIGGFGAVASAAMLGRNDQMQRDEAQRQRANGLTNNVYQNQHNPIGSQGTYGQIGQGYGMQNPNNTNPSQGGNRMDYGGRVEGEMRLLRKSSGTYNGDQATYFQMGGQNQGPQVGQIMDISPEQVQNLIKQGYKIQRV